MSGKSNRLRELARYKMFAGADMLAEAVRVPLAARGRDMLLGRSYREPTLTKDRSPKKSS